MDISTIFFRILWAFQDFIGECIVSNQRFVDMIQHFNIFSGLGLGLYAVSTYSIVALSVYILTYQKKYLLSLIFVEILNLSLILTTMLVPSKAFRFFLGVQSFSYSMIIHSKIFEIAYAAYKSSRSKKSRRIKQAMLIKDEECPDTKLRQEFKSLWNSILGMGVSKHINVKFPFTIWPGTYDIVFLIAISIVGDICSYLLREFIPVHISPKNQFWAMSLVGSLWQCTALEYGYYFIVLICHSIGLLLPTSLLHKNPLLSTSIGEFWGIRWNPVIGKQLQDCYYKPLRILGAPRVVGMLGTFLGSAIVHAIPAFISSDGDLTDSYSMFYFFFCQGISIIVEAIGLHVYKYILLRYFPRLHSQVMKYKKEIYLEHHALQAKTNYTVQKEMLHEPSRVLKSYFTKLVSLKNYYFVELCAVVVIIYFNYAYYEVGFSMLYVVVFSLLGVFVLVNVVKSYHENIGMVEPNLALAQLDQIKHNKRAKRVAKACIPFHVKCFVNGGVVVGWIWTVSCMLPQLTYFVTPMMKVINEFYSESFAVGPIVRTIEKFMYYYG